VAVMITGITKLYRYKLKLFVKKKPIFAHLLISLASHSLPQDLWKLPISGTPPAILSLNLNNLLRSLTSMLSSSIAS